MTLRWAVFNEAKTECINVVIGEADVIKSIFPNAEVCPMVYGIGDGFDPKTSEFIKEDVDGNEIGRVECPLPPDWDDTIPEPGGEAVPGDTVSGDTLPGDTVPGDTLTS